MSRRATTSQAEAAAPVGMIFGLVQNVILVAFIYLMVVRPGAKF